MAGKFLPELLIYGSLLPAIFGAGPVAQPPCAAQAEGFLDGRLAFWQQRLNLGEWKITVVMSQSADLKPKTLGNVHWDSARKTAVIRVLRAEEYHLSCREMLDDMELTVVHELVHLELSSLPRSATSRGEEEHAVNRIAGALLGLDRQKEGGLQPARDFSSAEQPVAGN